MADEDKIWTVPNGIWTRIIGTGFDMYQNSGQILRVYTRGNSITDVEAKHEEFWRIRAHRDGTP